jgi:hypothetical protein
MMASLTGTSPRCSCLACRTAAGTITPVRWRSSTTLVVAPTRFITRSAVCSRNPFKSFARESASATRYSSSNEAKARRVCSALSAGNDCSAVLTSSAVVSRGWLTGGLRRSTGRKLSSARSTPESLTSRASTTASRMSSPRPKRCTNPPAPVSTISVSTASVPRARLSTSVFSPTVTTSVARSGVWPVVAAPLTLTPLRLPRSSSTSVSPRK